MLFSTMPSGNSKALNDIAKALAALRGVRAQINAGLPLSRLQIPKNMHNLLTLTGSEDAPQVELCTEVLQQTVEGLGFYAIASSQDLSAQERREIYAYRDVSEQQFSLFASQLASDVTRVHDNQRMQTTFAMSFIAAILQTEIELVCRNLSLHTNSMLCELDQSVLILMPNEE